MITELSCTVKDCPNPIGLKIENYYQKTAIHLCCEHFKEYCRLRSETHLGNEDDL